VDELVEGLDEGRLGCTEEEEERRRLFLPRAMIDVVADASMEEELAEFAWIQLLMNKLTLGCDGWERLGISFELLCDLNEPVLAPADDVVEA
jgi:hypothetical protein